MKRGVVHVQTAQPPSRLGRRVRRWLIHRALRWLMTLHRAALAVATLTRRGRQARSGGAAWEILLTGTFYSSNWLAAHIHPLAASERCSRVYVVSTHPVPTYPKVVPIYPPRWLQRLVGSVPARMCVFACTAVRKRPHIVGGFHLLLNGLIAGVLARLVGARSLYFCVGGPMEVLDGGIWAENRLFGKLEEPDPVVEQRLIRAVSTFDMVVTMGTRAVRFFQQRGADVQYHVVPGGIDTQQFAPANTTPSTDLILVGRLVRIKRIDLFLHTVEHVARRFPHVTATVVGDGELRESLETLARTQGIDGRVSLVGHQDTVQEWLRRAKIFVLTSDSEGLALSLMEAMMCGLPAVVSNVGDLPDLVDDGVNGYLVDERSPEAFAERITALLGDPVRLHAFSRAARKTAARYGVRQTARQWDVILEDLDTGAQAR